MTHAILNAGAVALALAAVGCLAVLVRCAWPIRRPTAPTPTEIGQHRLADAIYHYQQVARHRQALEAWDGTRPPRPCDQPTQAGAWQQAMTAAQAAGDASGAHAQPRSVDPLTAPLDALDVTGAHPVLGESLTREFARVAANLTLTSTGATR